jgi:hypothetical protein
VGEHLVRVIGQTCRAPVAGKRSPHVQAPRSAHNPRTVRDLNNKDLMAAYLNGRGGHWQRRLRGVRNQRLESERVSPSRFVPWSGTGDGPVILYADEQYASAAVR